MGTRFWSLYASVYDTLLALRPYRAMLGEVVAAVGPLPGRLVLDAGCGSGNLTMRLLAAGHRVEALDASEGMLQRARQKSDRVCWGWADLNARLDYPEACFDAVVCSNVLYSLPQPRRTLEEFARLLKPGGVLVLTNPRPHFNMGEILRAHWVASTRSQRLDLLMLLPRLLLLAAFNWILLWRQPDRPFYFPEDHELTRALVSAGFQAVTAGPTYALQGWLATGLKAAVGEI